MLCASFTTYSRFKKLHYRCIVIICKCTLVEFEREGYMYIDLGKKIKEERLQKGYTQEELGEKIDSTGAYIGQIERGERNASMEKIILIAEALNVSIDYLSGNVCITEQSKIDEEIVGVLKQATNKQKAMMIDVLRIIKKYK